VGSKFGSREGKLMIMKRKLEEIQPQGSVNYIPKYCFGFSVPEVSIADVLTNSRKKERKEEEEDEKQATSCREIPSFSLSII
jgi:hypothetical protein